jgi:hypothetical protein
MHKLWNNAAQNKATFLNPVKLKNKKQKQSHVYSKKDKEPVYLLTEPRQNITTAILQLLG